MPLPSFLQTEADFTAIYNTYFGGLYKYVLVQVKAEDIAQDIVQDVFLYMWEHRNHIQIHTQLKSYLYRSCHNKVIDFYRQVSKNERLQNKLLHAYSRISLERDVHTNDLYKLDQLADEALDYLPPQRRKVFELCRHQGKTYQQAAEELGISPHTVKEHMAHALSSLRSFLNKRTDLVSLLFLLKKYFF